MKIIVRKTLKYSAIIISTILILMILLPILFPGVVTNELKTLSKESLNSEISFKDTDVSFFKHFPNLTVTLNDFLISGSAPFENDTLIGGKEISFGINLASLFKESIEVNKLFFDKTYFQILTDASGKVNYDIYKSDTLTVEVQSGMPETHLNIEGITITNSRFVYEDQSFPMSLKINKLEYLAKARFDNSLFRLESGLFSEGVSFSYDGTEYLQNKDVKGSMITAIDIDAFKIDLIKNELMVNDLPVKFNGSTTLQDKGYDIDFQLVSGETNFANFFSILPSDYDKWFKNTKFGGSSKLTFTMKGISRENTGQEPDLNVHLTVKNGKIQNNLAPKPLENLTLNFNLGLPSFNYDSLVLAIDTLKFTLADEATQLNLLIKGMDVPFINASINSKINLDLLTQAIGLDSIKFVGNLKINANLRGVYDEQKQIIPTISSDIRLENGFLQTPYYPNPVEQITINALINNKSNSISGLNIELLPVTFSFEQQAFSLKTSLSDFDDLKYEIIATGTLDLEKLYKVFAVEDFSVNGLLIADLNLKGRQSDAEKGKYQKLNNHGTLELRNVNLKSNLYPNSFNIPSAVLTFENDKAWIKNSTLKYLENAFTLNGYFQNFIVYALFDNELKGNMQVNCNLLIVEDFMMPADTTIDTTTSTAAVQLPVNLDFTINSNIHEIIYSETKISDFIGNVGIQKGKLSLRNTGFNIAGAHLLMNASYLPTTTQRADFNFSMKADSFDVQRAYHEIPMFKELLTSAENTEGLISMEYALKGRLNEKMEAIYPSIKGKGYIKLENVKVKGLELFSAIGKAVGKDSIRDPNLEAVVINSSIANNIITIEKTKMKVFGFRPTFSGQTSFDGKLNLHLRLGLPPLGLVGIPMSITGTSDNPIVKVRKEQKYDKLQETIDNE